MADFVRDARTNETLIWRYNSTTGVCSLESVKNRFVIENTRHGTFYKQGDWVLGIKYADVFDSMSEAEKVKSLIDFEAENAVIKRLEDYV